MTKEDLKKLLTDKPGYLKCGAPKLSRLFSVSKRTAREAVREVSVLIAGSNKEFKRLFFDIETSPNIVTTWRAGYKINISPDDIIRERAIICISYKWANESKVYNLRWDEDQNDEELLAEFAKVIEQADEVVAHNGDKFDLRWIRTRCLRFEIPFPAYIKSVDTLKKAKSMFYFNSNKLNYIAQFLKVGEKLETGGYSLWQDVFLKNDRKALQKMVDYCDQDVILLEKVYNKLMPYVKPDSHVGVKNSGEKASCPNCGSNKFTHSKEMITAAGVIQHRCKCNTCMSYFKLSDTVYKKSL